MDNLSHYNLELSSAVFDAFFGGEGGGAGDESPHLG